MHHNPAYLFFASLRFKSQFEFLNQSLQSLRISLFDQFDEGVEFLLLEIVGIPEYFFNQVQFILFWWFSFQFFVIDLFEFFDFSLSSVLVFVEWASQVLNVEALMSFMGVKKHFFGVVLSEISFYWSNYTIFSNNVKFVTSLLEDFFTFIRKIINFEHVSLI